MYIDKVKVKNFRLLKDFELDLREQTSLLVGKNNCGKTSILTIMEKLLKSGDKHFEWHDFNILFQKYFFDKILNYYPDTTEEFIPEGIIMQLYITYTVNDNFYNIQKYMMDLDPENNIIVLEFSYSCKENQFKHLKEVTENMKIKTFKEFSKYMTKYSSKYFDLKRYSRGFDFSSKETTKETSNYIDLSEIKKLVNFRSIKANREASNKVNDNSLSTLSQRYHDINTTEEGPVITALQNAIENADKELSTAYNGSEDSPGIFTEVFESIKQFGDETDITIQSTISDVDLLRNNTTLYYKNEGFHLPENYNGLGYLNLIGMIFEIETIISEFHRLEEKPPSDINILFIEEPEAHTHPQLQYIFIKNIKTLIKERLEKNSNSIYIQTIITTHSSHIVSECNFDDLRYLIRDNNTLNSKKSQDLKNMYQSDYQAFKFVKQYLNLNQSELFFTDKAIFIEGDTERILLPAMMLKIDSLEDDQDSIPLLSQNISIVEAGAYSHIFKPLMNFLGIKCLIITDIDGVESKCGKACSSKDAKFTSNSSIKGLLDLPDCESQFKRLTEMRTEDKIINNNVRLAYQTPLEKDNLGEYHPRTFEDSFIYENFEFLKLNARNLINGLKKSVNFSVVPPDFYEFSKDSIAKKSSFAIEVLFYDGITDNKEWNVPDYIEEGLKWLKNL